MKFQITNFKSQFNIQAIILVSIIAIFIVTVSVAFISASSSASDQKRVSDIEIIQQALNLYFNENGIYPASTDGIPKGIETYLEFWPVAPIPSGNCSDSQNTYSYSPKFSSSDYSLSFCLGQGHNELASGVHKASSKGVQ